MRTINLIIGDRFKLFAEGLLVTIEKSNHVFPCQVLGIAHQIDQLYALLERNEAQLLILDIQMPADLSPWNTLKLIHAKFPDLRIMLLSSSLDTLLLANAIENGAAGFFLRTQSGADLLMAIKMIMEGHNYWAGNAANLLKDSRLPAFSMPDQASSLTGMPQQLGKNHSLTKRELEILQLISQAFSNKEIAKKLFISDQTVSVHRKNIMRKLGVSNTAGLIKTAYEHSLV